jgi:hypothetical protein
MRMVTHEQVKRSQNTSGWSQISLLEEAPENASLWSENKGQRRNWEEWIPLEKQGSFLQLQKLSQIEARRQTRVPRMSA